MDFSKRVILGSSNNESLNYNGVFLAGDVNGDGKLDMGDYDLVFENIGTSKVTKDTLKFDINKDGKIDIADLTYINSNMGATQGKAVIENTDAIIDVNSISVDESKFKLESGTSIKDIFIDNEDLVNVLKSPKVEKKEKEQLIENIFKKFVSEDITGLLVIMVSKDRQTKIVSTLEYFIKRIYEYKKIGVAYVTTAWHLSDNQKLSIVSRLLSTTDYVDFKMNYDIDESLIAGMVIRIGDRVVDSSIKHKIDELTRNLKNIQLA